MTTISSILRIGNSCGIIIPSQMLKSLSLSAKDKLVLSQKGGLLTLRKLPSTAQAPFLPLDIWCEEHGYEGQGVEDSLEYVDSIKSERHNKDITLW